VAIKEKALTQSEKLRATYRSQENNCNEVNSLRMLVDDLEKKLAESHTEMLALKSEKTSVMDQMKTYKQACESKQLLLDNANQRYGVQK
jgi:chromosome segregation ATPase